MVSVSLKEALTLFPEVTPELPRLLQERKEELYALQKKISKVDEAKLRAMRDHWKHKRYHEAITLETLVDNSPFYSKQRALQLQVYAYETALNKRDSVAQEEIDSAKRYPLEKLLPANARRNGRFHLCPFHKEKTASLHIFKNNAYHCFGCSKHGDTISLVMELYHLDFKSSVRAINSYGVL